MHKEKKPYNSDNRISSHMQLSFSFIRVLFLGLSILFLSTYMTIGSSEENYYTNLAIGMGSGLIIGCLIISLDTLFKRFNLRAFNTAVLGLFFGYLMGKAILLILQAILNVTGNYNPETIGLVSAFVFLFSSYFGMIMTARASDELYISIPFIKFKSNNQKKKDLLMDPSLLIDSRMIDLASSGLLDHHLIFPRFLLKEFYDMLEHTDENTRSKARRCLEVLKKLETIPNLEIRYADADFPEIKESSAKIIRLARLLDANILTGDFNRTQQTTVEGVRIINIHTLSTALKPLAQTGEYINIKIQRYGKEPRQGVGYLEDGTMVVVNGGADYIGEGIRAQVLSVKHTSSGRMIFCNAFEEQAGNVYMESGMGSAEHENSAKNYFAL
jgi:uncharacterized protein YacL